MIDPPDSWGHLPVASLVSAGGTNVGLVRKLNEDCRLDRPDLGLWAVADGMGGHRAGDLASRTIVTALNALARPRTALDLMTALRQALARANQDLRSCAGRYRADEQAGSAIVASTVVCLLIFGGHYAGVWAGDSRLYLVRGGRIVQVSHDHSVVQELVDAGRIDSEAARRHPSSNQVTRAIGADDWIDLEVVQDDLHPGDVFLLCSDGINRIIDDGEIAAIVATGAPAAAVRTLIDLALSRGAPDNVTAVVVRWDAEFREDGREGEDGRESG